MRASILRPNGKKEGSRLIIRVLDLILEKNSIERPIWRRKDEELDIWILSRSDFQP